LSAEERRAAVVLSRALGAGRAALDAGARSGDAVARAMRATVETEPAVDLDYAVAVDADTLEPVSVIDDPESLHLLIAAQVGPVRLIDNCAALPVADDIPTGGASAPVRQLERIG
jgi:pantoate--beta-alanine ligase